MQTPKNRYMLTPQQGDNNTCGKQNRPCQTITQALKRARETQLGPRGKDIDLINIEIARHLYRIFAVKSNWIRFRGAGTGVSIIQSPSGSAVFVSSSQPVLFEGLTIKAQGAFALVATDNSFINVSGCEFRDSRGGITLLNSSSARIFDSAFSNNQNGLGVSNGSTALVSDLTIAGQSVTQGFGVSWRCECSRTPKCFNQPDPESGWRMLQFVSLFF